MKSSISSTNRQFALIRENLNRFWPLSLISMLLYLFAGITPVLISYKNLNNIETYLSMSLNGTNPFFLASVVAFPVLIGVAIFRYLHNSSSVSIIHSMPFTRTKLFWGNFLSGGILLCTPILVTGIIYLILAKNVIVGSVNIFTHTAVLWWIISTLTIAIFNYTIVIFASMCSGNTAIHSLLSLFFIFLAPALYGTIHGYFELYLIGYPGIEHKLNTILRLSPLTNLFNDGTKIQGGNFLAYIAVAVLLLIISVYMYRIRKLERASDSIVFKSAEPVLAGLITFFGMTVMGILFFSINNGGILFSNMGYALGAILFFIISYMIIKKSPKIFNKNTLKIFLAYVILIAIFLSSIQIDWFHYGSKHPDVKNISQASLNMNTFDFLEGIPRVNKTFNYNEFATPVNSEYLLTDKNQIEHLTKLQKQLYVLAKSKKRKNLYDSDLKLEFVYNTTKNKSIYSNENVEKRAIIIDSKDIPKLKDLHTIVQSDHLYRYFESILSYKENYDFTISLMDKFNYYGKSGALQVDDNKVKELTAAILKDFKAQTLNQTLTDKMPLISINIENTSKKKFNIKDTALKKRLNARMTNRFTFNVYPWSVNTLKFLAENGHKNIIDNLANQFESVEIYRIHHNSDDSSEQVLINKIKNPEKIKALVSSIPSEQAYKGKRYLISFIYKEPLKDDFDEIVSHDFEVRYLDSKFLKKN